MPEEQTEELLTPIDIDAFKEFVQSKMPEDGKIRIAVFAHKTPDCDAIGSMMGVRFLFNRAFNAVVDIFQDGEVSHPQNNALTQLLDPQLQKLEEYSAEKYHLNILVDCIPQAKVGKGDLDIKFDIIIDHHKDLPSGFDGLVVHYNSGSCCSIIYNLICGYDIPFIKENDIDCKIATALLAGIITDTDNCMSNETVSMDFHARQDLSQFKDEDALHDIIYYEVPLSWIKFKGFAINEVLGKDAIHEGVAAVGLGIISGEHRDVIAYIAGEVLSWKTVHTAVAFAIIDGSRIEGSIRTRDRSMPLSEIAKKLGGGKPQFGSGGGRGSIGGYCKNLGSVSIEPDEPDDLKQEMWLAIKKREIAKIVKIINK